MNVRIKMQYCCTMVAWGFMLGSSGMQAGVFKAEG